MTQGFTGKTIRLGSPQLWDFFPIGTWPIERWVIPGVINNVALGTTVLAANNLYAVPFISGHGGTLDKISIRVTAGSAGAARLGLYTAVSETDLQPSALVADFGTVVTTSIAVVSIASLARTLTPATLYWLALVSNATPTISSIGAGGMYSIWGVGNTLPTTVDTGYIREFTYAALPDPFGSGTINTTRLAFGLFFKDTN